MNHSKSFDLFIIAASAFSIGILIGRNVSTPEPEPHYVAPPISSTPAITWDFSQHKEIGTLCFTPRCDQEHNKPLSPPPACFPTDYNNDDDLADSPRNWELHLDDHYRDIQLANEQHPTSSIYKFCGVFAIFYIFHNNLTK